MCKNRNSKGVFRKITALLCYTLDIVSDEEKMKWCETERLGMTNRRKRSRNSNSAIHPVGSAAHSGEDKRTQRPGGSENHPDEEKQTKQTEDSVNHTDEEKHTQSNCPYSSEKPPISNENEKIAIYESLRNEIISTQGMRTNLIVYMFSVYFLLFGYGVGNDKSHNLCFVATYFVLLAFQTKIIRSKYTIARISVFIRDYYEPKTKEKLYKWETINLKNDFYRTNNKVITFFSSTAAFQLGFLSLFAIVISVCKANEIGIKEICSLGIKKVICSWSNLERFLIIICIICQIILFFIRDDYKVDKKIIEKMSGQFKDIEI